MNKEQFLPALRLNQALTASLERRALTWMANRAPRWLTSDQLTVLGLSAQIGAGAGYVLSRYNRYYLLLVILCLILNWFGDSMDGTLARVRCRQRPRYGFYVDHMVDIFGSVALMCGLGLSGFLHWQTATIFGHRMLLFDIGGAIAAVCMFATAIRITVRHAAELYRDEPLL